MPKAKQYEYNGEMVTVAELAEITKIPISAVRRRLCDGWSVEKVINTPYCEIPSTVDASLIGKPLQVIFRQPIPNVIKDMQPLLDTVYTTTPLQGARTKNFTKQYCVIYLENGKPLIVYPSDFEIVSTLN